jgi:nucleotide-binding universal stress UspA family protein
MEKKILLSVDDSRHSMNAIQYALDISTLVPKLNYVLFHVQPMISLFMREEAQKDIQAKKALERLLKKNDQFAIRLLDEYKNKMVRLGISEDRIEISTRPRKLGLAKDILEYSKENRYDAIVIGRRGLSRLQEMVLGSASANIIEHSQITPVWLVDGNVIGSKLMAAVDGSEASLRAIDHLSFMLAGNPDTRLTLLHVTTKARDYCEVNFNEEPSADLEEIVARGDKACIDQFYAHALRKFENSGITEHQVDMKTLKGRGSPGRDILKAAEKGNYSTLVIGRRGIEKAFFMGRVSRYIINRASDRAIWLVP